jgi:hypothetical protein
MEKAQELAERALRELRRLASETLNEGLVERFRSDPQASCVQNPVDGSWEHAACPSFGQQALGVPAHVPAIVC